MTNMITKAIPHAVTIPNGRKMKAIVNNRRILNIDRVIVLKSTNLALRVAIKMESIESVIAISKVIIIKVGSKIGLCLITIKAGDHISRPATKTTADIKLRTPITVKTELINWLGLFVFGKKRMMEIVSPSVLRTVNKLIAEIIAELDPTSDSE